MPLDETTPQVISVRPVSLPAGGRGTELEVRITAPTAGSGLPVIVFAHGFSKSMTSYDPLVDHWAANGFVVVQPTFLDSATLGITPADPRYPTIWRTRVDDLERVIDELGTIVAAVPGLADRVDVDRLAVAGHSWGGQSVGMLLGARVLDADGKPGEDRTDERVKAGILLATTGIARGDLAPFAQENFAFMSPDFSGLTTPSLVVAGDHDQSALSSRGPDWFTDVYRLSPGAHHLVTLHGGEHSLGGIQDYESTATTDESPERVDLVRRTTTAFLKTSLGVEEGAWSGLEATTVEPVGHIESKSTSPRPVHPETGLSTVTRNQRPLSTGFTATSTADDVLAGVDLSGRNVIVTGGHGRLGREVTRALAAAGASVTVASRDVERASAAVAGIPGVQVEALDLTDPASVDAFAERWLATGRPLHVLVNNAAMLFTPELLLDSRGNELSFSTSHLGHFQLTRALLPALRSAGGARVLTVTSGAARFGEIRWDDLAFSRGYDAGAAYGQSKRANVLFTVELDRRYASEGIRAFAAHPGVIIGKGPHDPSVLASYREQGLVDEQGVTIIDPEVGKKTLEQGAGNLVFGAASPLLDGIGGVYLKDGDVAPLVDEVRPLTADSIPSDANSAMLNPDDARRLWAVSEALLA